MFRKSYLFVVLADYARLQSEMFSEATSFNSNMNGWDVSMVQDMTSMFDSAISFNSDISSWDTSNVISMKRMFSNASAFNVDLSSWDVSSVASLTHMFDGAKSFNQSLCAWGQLLPSNAYVSRMFSGTSCIFQEDPDLSDFLTTFCTSCY